jgi:hypothetical protein
MRTKDSNGTLIISKKLRRKKYSFLKECEEINTTIIFCKCDKTDFISRTEPIFYNNFSIFGTGY